MGLSDLLRIFDASAHRGSIREMPDINDLHESNVKGLYVIGDLTDAPVIKIALRQGYTIAQQVHRSLSGPCPDGAYDTVIIGAGPAGIGAALALQEVGARFLVLERDRPFSTIQNFTKGKLIFSEPREHESPASLWFEDAPKEELIARWDAALSSQSLPIEHPAEVTRVEKQGQLFTIHTAARPDAPASTYRARRIILATGKRGESRRLGVPGESLPHVTYALDDPDAHRGERVLVVGGGDSAVETAVSLAEAGASVSISYRKHSFYRAKRKNQTRIQALIDQGRIRTCFSSTVTAITASSVTLEQDGASVSLPADRVFIHIGTKLPSGFLKRLGVRMQDEMTVVRMAWVSTFALLTYLFYILKSGVVESDGVLVAKRGLFPFGADDPLGWLPGALQVDLGFRVVDGAFWGTTFYALLILFFGLYAMRKYRSTTQRRRYASLIAFQWIFLFGIPELLAPFLIGLGGEGGFWWNLFGGDRGWKFYGLSVPWPLNIWAFIDAPSWTATGNTLVVLSWMAVAGLVTFVLLPLYIRRDGQRFCSYLCGCGGLAETLGDMWRHLAPRGLSAKKSEAFGRVIFLLAIPTTLLIVSDAWGFISSGALLNAKAFAQHWYMLMVDFWLASVLGVAAYPYLGNRIWCRFFCPLRAYMEEISRRISRIAIVADDRCIGCGECTRYCQMGIDVQQFAQQQVELSNGNSSCIQCGICVEVCPMEVLSIKRGEVVTLLKQDWTKVPAASWEQRVW